jgi:hypothetical protein
MITIASPRPQLPKTPSQQSRPKPPVRCTGFVWRDQEGSASSIHTVRIRSRAFAHSTTLQHLACMGQRGGAVPLSAKRPRLLTVRNDAEAIARQKNYNPHLPEPTDYPPVIAGETTTAPPCIRKPTFLPYKP